MFLAQIGSRLWVLSDDITEDRRASRPLVDGWVVLVAMPPDSGFVAAKDIATETGISVRRVKKALYTMASLGLIEHDPESQRYRIARWHL